MLLNENIKLSSYVYILNKWFIYCLMYSIALFFFFFKLKPGRVLKYRLANSQYLYLLINLLQLWQNVDWLFRMRNPTQRRHLSKGTLRADPSTLLIQRKQKHSPQGNKNRWIRQQTRIFVSNTAYAYIWLKCTWLN